ncbi:hypothetical protein BC829DRAFT_421053 [Chytridium lagenaria]|nr:hypothetical protein BC829DRAFT_421053 [Chytridium lagenaria]
MSSMDPPPLRYIPETHSFVIVNNNNSSTTNYSYAYSVPITTLTASTTATASTAASTMEWRGRSRYRNNNKNKKGRPSRRHLSLDVRGLRPSPLATYEERIGEQPNAFRLSSSTCGSPSQHVTSSSPTSSICSTPPLFPLSPSSPKCLDPGKATTSRRKRVEGPCRWNKGKLLIRLPISADDRRRQCQSSRHHLRRDQSQARHPYARSSAPSRRAVNPLSRSRSLVARSTTTRRPRPWVDPANRPPRNLPPHSRNAFFASCRRASQAAAALAKLESTPLDLSRQTLCELMKEQGWVEDPESLSSGEEAGEGHPMSNESELRRRSSVSSDIVPPIFNMVTREELLYQDVEQYTASQCYTYSSYAASSSSASAPSYRSATPRTVLSSGQVSPPYVPPSFGMTPFILDRLEREGYQQEGSPMQVAGSARIDLDLEDAFDQLGL